jgi:squalene-hopene/tetraprenyl-beta-curcumene cyclase
MVDYLGVLDEVHFHAVVRTALRAHGFCLPLTAAEELVAEHHALGCHFVEEVFPRCRPAFAADGPLERLQSVDHALWERVPLTAALGWRQTRALQSLSLPRNDVHTEDVFGLGAAFNAAITVIDYVVDERPDGVGVFQVLDPKLISAIFDLSCDIQSVLGSVYKQLDDPHLQLLLALVGMCAAEGRRLCLAGGNHDAWQALGRLVLQLLDAERRTALVMHNPEAVSSPSLLDAMERKSVLPSVAMLHIAQLGAASLPSETAMRAATTLGRVFWRIDDLADLLTDCRRGVPSALVVRLAEFVIARNRAVAADADLYDIVDQTAHEMVCLLEPAAFADPSKWAGDANALSSLVEFARSYVGAWVNWRDDAPRPIRYRQAGPGTRLAAGAALGALLAEQREGFHEAVHNLRFPRVNHQYEVHPASLSFRAVALDAMLDARDAGFGVPETMLSFEALKILQSKHRLVRGGWSYIPEVPELPPDADDNGQVIQVLWRLGGCALAASCDEPIRMSLDAMDPSGGVVTWIIDPRGDTHADEAVRAYLSVMGGWGIHPEVVANFAYGLCLLDRVRFAGPLQNIAAYLERAQNSDGSWTSKWYDGPYYGTFRAAAVLRRVRPSSFSMDRARTFILTRQRHDGSWGEPLSSPLSSAFALLALDELDLTSEPAFERGIEHLKAMQHRTGRWPACRWIRFPTVDGEVAYGSETITTAFCLKALTAVH